MSIVLDGTNASSFSGGFAGVNTPNTFGFKNLLIDAGFTINQRGYVSAATLASGSYGHDRWKAGASGGNYTFTQLASSTTITIASGKSLIQVVEDKNVNGTSFVLSWTGTAQARYAVNSATPSGSYATSPILITGQTVGTTMSVEFNTGTLTNPQLELGSTATSFDYRDYGRELIMCQRYYEKQSATSTGLYTGFATGSATSTTTCQSYIKYTVSKRSAPVLTVSNVALSDGVAAPISIAAVDVAYYGIDSLVGVVSVASGLTQYRPYIMVANNNAAGYIALSAEL